MTDFEKLDAILLVNESVIYVGIIDYMGNLIADRTKSLDHAIGGEAFKVDLCVMKNILDLEDSAYGKIISVHSKRENIQQLIYYLDDAMVYVACDPLTSAKNMAEISDRIGELLSKLAILS